MLYINIATKHSTDNREHLDNKTSVYSDNGRMDTRVSIVQQFNNIMNIMEFI